MGGPEQKPGNGVPHRREQGFKASAQDVDVEASVTKRVEEAEPHGAGEPGGIIVRRGAVVRRDQTGPVPPPPRPNRPAIPVWLWVALAAAVLALVGAAASRVLSG